MTEDDVALRREKILIAARWCFLNFGFAKTSFEDIAKRANLSRTLLYRTFRDKDDVYRAVFAQWLLSQQPFARDAARGAGSAQKRLLTVCQLLVLRPWAEMAGAPMGREFLQACERIDPASASLYRKMLNECVLTVLRDKPSAEVFLLALDGLVADQPSLDVLEQRTQLLVARFAPRSPKKTARS
jgi:AcrR family transcriptional regulator